MMRGRRMRREVPEINATSTADMAFMLLVFFLLTTSVGDKKGLRSELPPMPQKEQSAPMQVKKRNLLVVRLDTDGKVWCNDKPVPMDGLKEYAKNFIANPENRDDLPQKHMASLPGLGQVYLSDLHTIALHYDADADYKTYFAVQNQLAAAYRELRDELSMKAFHCKYAQASPEEQEAVRTCYPQRISEMMEGGPR